MGARIREGETKRSREYYEEKTRRRGEDKTRRRAEVSGLCEQAGKGLWFLLSCCDRHVVALSTVEAATTCACKALLNPSPRPHQQSLTNDFIGNTD